MASLSMLDNEGNAMQKPHLRLGILFTVLIFYFFSCKSHSDFNLEKHYVAATRW